MSWQQEKQELNEKLTGLNLLRVEDGDEIDLVFGDYHSGEELFKLQLAYGPGVVITNLVDLRNP